MKNRFVYYQQLDQMDCGATCLRMIFRYYGRSVSINKIRQLCQTTKTGVNLLGISEAAETLGFRTYGAQLDLDQLNQVELPCILHWDQNHFVVLYKINKGRYYIADPGTGMLTMDKAELTRHWFANKGHVQGLSLLLSPSPAFYEIKEEEPAKTLNWGKIITYFYRYRRLFIQLLLGLAISSILLVIAPFLTQSVVDIGISSKNIGFVNLMLIAQLLLFVGQTTISFIRSWILLHISTRVNISILTDLLIKLMRLPMSFFDLKTNGDLIQRIEDQQRIESFLTGPTLSTLFSLVNILVFGTVLAVYNGTIFLIFIIATVCHITWIMLFMRYRRELDDRRFKISSDNQTYMIEMIQSIRDIKLNNSQKQKRWGWEKLQARLFKYKVKSLALSHYQTVGSMALNQIKGILITFVSAKLVIDGHITLGSMMAIQYVVGMANSPIEQILLFMQSYQDAKISLDRLNEIYEFDEEESQDKDYITEIGPKSDIEVRNVTFRYMGAGNKPIFKDFNLTFPEGKTTAIVGMSGSGKTTILKLLMRFYDLEGGEITVGGKNIDQISHHTWRESCGIVMQESHIFADTIENNIAVGEDHPNKKRLEDAIQTANLVDFIAEQPFGIQTRIGMTGKGISQGQKQRLLIARAVYKQPQFIFFDEATNSLDANNERVIIENLNLFFKNRTVVVVAHRLSTVKNADNIVVLDQGQIVEQGTHEELVTNRESYFQLVKNQLELGS